MEYASESLVAERIEAAVQIVITAAEFSEVDKRLSESAARFLQRQFDADAAE